MSLNMNMIEGEILENITNILKQARINKGLSVDEAVARTKFTKAQIMAIEEGNIEFFKTDLSYFSYMIRYYCKALDVDYETLRTDVETIVSADVFTQEIEAIRRSAHVDEGVKETKPIQPKRVKKNIDYSFIAFLTTSVLLVAILIFVGIKVVPKWFEDKPNKNPSGIVNPTPNEPEEPQEPEEPVEPEPSFVVTQTQDANKFEIKNWTADEEIEIKIVFKAPETWISASVNNAILSEPQSKTYLANEEAILVENMSENKEIMFHMGKMSGNEFYINGEKLELDETVQNNAGVVKLYFKFIKDGIEN